MADIGGDVALAHGGLFTPWTPRPEAAEAYAAALFTGVPSVGLIDESSDLAESRCP